MCVCMCVYIYMHTYNFLNIQVYSYIFVNSQKCFKLASANTSLIECILSNCQKCGDSTSIDWGWVSKHFNLCQLERWKIVSWCSLFCICLFKSKLEQLFIYSRVIFHVFMSFASCLIGCGQVCRVCKRQGVSATGWWKQHPMQLATQPSSCWCQWRFLFLSIVFLPQITVSSNHLNKLKQNLESLEH